MIDKIKSLNKYTKLAVMIMLIAIILRFYLVSIYTVSGDACWHFSVSKFIGNNLEVPLFESLGRDEPFWAPPLFHITASAFYKLFGSAGLKLVAPLFGSLTLITAYLIFRKFINEKASFYAILFISFIPISIDYNVLGYVESMLVFFVTLSIYLALSNRFLASGIIAGLSILTKYNGVFVIPVLLYIAYKHGNRKISIKNSLMVTVIPGIIGIPWFIRNWILLGNPVWPFLNFIFKGVEKQSYSGFDISNLFSINTYVATYLGFFGVPDGNYKTLAFVDFPFLGLALIIFLIGTFVFILPLLFGFEKRKGNKIFYALLASFTVLFILYIINVGPFVSRMLLPAIIAFAFFYGVGSYRLIEKHKNLEKAFFILIILIVSGFVLAETAKFTLASKSWNFYQEDFNWVKANTQKDSVFIAGGMCIQYHIDRTSLFPSEIDSDAYDYIWVNQDFKLDNKVSLNNEQLQSLENKDIVYENKATKTKIYEVMKQNFS